MAIRDDFAAGEVLTAADLNDTFGSKLDVQAQQSNRNLLYNGAMQVAQRGTSTTGITVLNYYTADRWAFGGGSLGTWTMTVENDAPTGSGFRRSSKVLCTTADAAPAAGDFLLYEQRLEGQDLQRIAKGTSSAQQLSLSFWVKANVTGTYIIELDDSDNTRSVSASYTVSASATWERKTITFPADTTGAFNNDNGTSLRVIFWLGAGSSFTSGSLATTWGAQTTANRAVGQTNVAAATNNYWQVTGVQLEVGPAATAFEFKSYGRELAECQRYYWRQTASSAYTPFGVGVSTGATTTQIIVRNPVPMRVAPTSVDASTLVASDIGSYNLAVTSISIGQGGTHESEISTGHNTGATTNRPGFLRANNSTSAYLGLSAEL